MSRALIVLRSQADRDKAAKWAQGVSLGSTVEFKAPKRTLPQNAALWSALTEISQQKAYHGVKLGPEDWKLVFMDALKREVRMVPNIDGTGFVNIGTSSSDLTAEEMTGLLSILYEWGSRNGVTFSHNEGG